MSSAKSPSSSAYSKPSATEDAASKHAKTVGRLAALTNQLATKPKGVRLAGRVCVITGAGSKKGIGRSSAFAFAHQGAAHLYLLDFAGDHLPELADALKTAYPDTKVTTIQGDAADEPTIAGLCQRAIQEEGRLDVFFANAGIATARLMADTTCEIFMRVQKVNALSCFLAIKHASEAMKKTSETKLDSRGSIILTASVAGIRSGAGDSAYSASKAAVNSLAKTTAYQLRGTDIRVNSICPGLVETGMTTEIFDYARTKGTVTKVGQLVPLERYAVSEEIAQTAVFLASDDSSFIDGQNIAVDGGLSASHPVVPGRLS